VLGLVVPHVGRTIDSTVEAINAGLRSLKADTGGCCSRRTACHVFELMSLSLISKVVTCSARGISLRTGGNLPARANVVIF